MAINSVSQLQYQWIDLRAEIADYERMHRPFPPRSGSTSRPVRRSTEPETDNGYVHAKWDAPGKGIRVWYRFSRGELERQVRSGN